MKAGKTEYSVGTKIKIKGLKGEDKLLNGRTGTLTHPFPGVGDGSGDVGVYLDNTADMFSGKVNLFIGEFETV